MSTQIIKLRRGSLEALSAVTSSLQKGEILIATGSSNLSAVTNGKSIVFAVPENGQVQATNRFLVGSSAPSEFAASTYNGMVDGVPYYDSGSGTLYLLSGNGNTAINLEGNIQPFSASVASSINALSASIGSGTIGNSVSLLNQFSASAEGRLNNLESTSASVDNSVSLLGIHTASVNSFTQSADGRLDNLEAFSSSQETKDSTLATYTASVDSKLSQLETASGSAIGRLNNLESTSASVLTEQTEQNNRLSTLEAETSSYARTDSGNIFNGTQVITGSLYITQDLVVYGSSSLLNVTASRLDLGDNTIVLNTATPAVRFAGIDVIDSGSTGATGSLYWDSINNHWLYVHPSGAGEGYNSAILIAGPKNTGALGEETGLTSGYIPVATGEDHIDNSIMSQTTGKITLSGSLDVYGEVSASTIVGIGNVSAFSQSVDGRLDSIESAIGDGSNIDTRLTSLEVFTGSQETKNSTLATYTASVDSRLSQLETDSGSQAARLNNLESTSASVNISVSNLNSYTASNDITNAAQTTRIDGLAALTASVESRLNQLSTDSGSQAARLVSLESFSGSQETKNSTLATYTGSVEGRFSTLATLTGSIATEQTTQNNRLTAIESFTSSFGTSFSSSVDSRLDVLEGNVGQALNTDSDVTFNSLNTAGNVIVGGDLVVQGNTVTLNTAQLVVEDKLITLSSGSTSSATSDGSGFEVAGTSANFVYQDSTTAFTSSVAVIAPAVTASLNVPGFGTSKRAAFRDAAGNIDFVAAPTTAGDLLQWDGTDFVMSNVIDGGSF